MDVDEFVALLDTVHLGALAVAEGELPAHGRCVARPLDVSRAPENPLEALVTRFDCTGLALGRVTFVSHPRPHFAGKVVGVFESDPIVLANDGSVSVFE